MGADRMTQLRTPTVLDAPPLNSQRLIIPILLRVVDVDIRIHPCFAHHSARFSYSF